MSRIGKNLIVDSYILKGFFVMPELIEIMNQAHFEELVKLIFGELQENSMEKSEFNNNQLKYRAEIQQITFELRLLLIKRMCSL